MKDEDPEVRNNATFGLGELVLHGRELLYPLNNNTFAVFRNLVLIHLFLLDTIHRSYKHFQWPFRGKTILWLWTTFVEPSPDS